MNSMESERGFKMGKAKRRTLQEVERDPKLSKDGFTTLHGTFIKKSYNSNYPNALFPK